MNTTTERVFGYRGASSAIAPWETVQSEDLYQQELLEAITADDYVTRREAPATAKGHLTRSDSTFVHVASSVSRAPVRVAEWDGYVTEVGQQSFAAILRGIAGEGVAGQSHDAEIALDDVGRSDRALLRPGAFFRICIYFELDEDDRPKRYAKVIFRRLPAYRQQELERADQRAEERRLKLRVE